MAVIDVIQWEFAPGVFARKFQNSELNTKTQLIVREGQEAVLMNSGQAFGPFGPGKHVLNTSNYPFLSPIIKVAVFGASPFPAEVWFISKASKLDIKWGTAGAIQIEDPKYHIMLPVRAFGQYGLVVDDSVKFLIKMIGMVPAFAEKVLADYFKGIVITRAKDLIAKYLLEKNVSILKISAYLNEISDTIEKQIAEDLAEYGMKIVNFTVNSISTDETDEAVKQLRKALATKAEMDIIGYTYQQKRSFDTMESVAGNSNGGVINAAVGMGMGMGMGVPMGNTMHGMMSNIDIENKKTCPNCGKSISENSAFCPFCGQSTVKEKGIVCDKCGKISAPGSKFCSACGDIFNCCPYCGCDNDVNVVVCVKCGKKLKKDLCPGCGVELTENSKFCSACGFKLQKPCSNCGKEVAPEVNFCPDCGNKIN